jgi:hypothetical protein
MIDTFCIPALLALLFGIAFVLYDVVRGNSFGAIMRLLLVLFTTLTFQLFCQNKLEWLSWTMILIPFLLFSIITAVIIFLSDIEEEKRDDDVKINKCHQQKNVCKNT